MTTVSDGLYQYGGIPVGGVFTAANKAWFVRPSTGSDGNTGRKPSSAFKTLAKALSMATADSGEVVYLIAESNTAASTFDFLTSGLDWNKDGVHLVGIGAGPFIGSRAGIRNSTSVATIEDLFTVSADNCLIANISIFHGDVTSTATAPRACVVSGMRNRFVNCQISGNGDTGGSMDVAGARSLAVTGAENTFQHCYIGLDTVIRGTQTTEVYVTTGARNYFEDCVINSYTSLSTFKALTCGSPDRFVILKNCMLCAVQGITSAVAPTGAIDSGTINGRVMILGGGVYGYADVTTADDTNVLQLTYSGLAANVVDQGVAKATDVA